MKDINELRDLSYEMGWTFIADKHIDLENGSCCPLAMYLLKNSLIDRDTNWLNTLKIGKQIFDHEELEGFIHGVAASKMKLQNYISAKKYSKGYLAGKQAREKWHETSI